jgi:molybdopterin converting factor small subunit
MNASAPIRVLFFSVVREAVGGLESVALTPGIDLPESPSLKDVLSRLEEKFPRLVAWRDRLLLAVDFEFASRDQRLKPGQEVALMPPVQGG